ncbi:hypothetical protein [Sediminivirga luteola]|uniref:Uncharacterized protein n=1 Tax=Sediminivirga luteola TaxID=1774748 RepID=A0A8J2U191_9MICO|nr:hypothetical protein [Sediminivirga luteola]GGA27862.1 hypothetical protein GCM10011333_33320 [Sediminivirga luteola]
MPEMRYLDYAELAERLLAMAEERHGTQSSERFLLGQDPAVLFTGLVVDKVTVSQGLYENIVSEMTALIASETDPWMRGDHQYWVDQLTELQKAATAT